MSKKAANNTRIKLKIEDLEKQSKLIRQELDGELDLAREKVADLGKILFGILGGLFVSAIIVGGIAGRKKNKDSSEQQPRTRRVHHKFRDQIAHELTGQATNFLLGLAKDKLATIIDKKETAQDDNSEVTS